MVQFDKKIFVLGCGGVVQCTLPLLFKIINIPHNRVTLMDFVDNRERVKEFLAQGVRYIQERLTKENYTQILSHQLSAGDLFIDLAWNTDTCALIEWCNAHDVLYVNTSVEEWDPYQNIENTDPSELTLYFRQNEMKKITSKWRTQSATTIVDHGANPGLVSHFTKQGLIDIAHKIIAEKPSDSRVNELKQAIAEKNFPVLGMLTGTKVIHISERDTQITRVPKEVNEFVNTWSIEGIIEEGIAPAELGWGTHEKTLPAGAQTHRTGPQNQIFLASRGMDTLVRSWVPAGPIIGMVIRHGEAYGISDRLTLWKNEQAQYRPTVHYAYCPSDSTIASLYELRMRNFVPQERRRIMNDDIISGKDEVGCLLMGHDFNSWWVGSVLDIEEARRLVPHQNATTLQVAISVVASAAYAIQNPTQGFCLPDDIDHEVILPLAKPYLGKFISQPVDWKPTAGPNTFLLFGDSVPQEENIWQFSTFLVKNHFYQ